MPSRHLLSAGLVTVIPALLSPGLGAQAFDTSLPRRVQLGATLGAVPDSIIAKGSPGGAVVLATIAGSPAAEAGIRAGDVIVRLARDTVRSVTEALAALKPLTGSPRVVLTLIRNRHPLNLTIALRERPKETSDEFAIEYRSIAARGGRHRVLIAHSSDGRPHPSVLLIGGIGCYSIDAPSGPEAYRDLMYHLTRRGYTTVRVEKLGVGDSEGSSCIDTDLETEVDGYRQALIAMKTHPAVDSSRVFLFGHSIGGIEAPLLAGEGAPLPRIRGVAVLSTAGISWYEYELANLRRQLELQDFPPDSIEAYQRLKTTCGYQFLIEKQSHDAVVSRDSSCARLLGYPASDAYMHSVADLAPAVLWKKVTAPALLMYGSSDFVTSRAEHLELTDYINAMHPGTARFADIAETDHYLSHQASLKASISDPLPNLSRPYYGAALEPVIDRWLDEISARSPPAPPRLTLRTGRTARRSETVAAGIAHATSAASATATVAAAQAIVSCGATPTSQPPSERPSTSPAAAHGGSARQGGYLVNAGGQYRHHGPQSTSERAAGE